MLKNINKFITVSLISSVFLSSFVQADLYYSAKIAGPVVNIFSINELGVVNKITDNKRWRDLEHSVSNKGLVSFSSNRKASDKILLNRPDEDFNLYIYDPSTKQVSQITKGPSQEQKPIFSPSGKELAFIRSDKKQQSLVVYSLQTKKEKTLITTKAIYDYAWSQHEPSIVFSSSTTNSARLEIIDTLTLARNVLITSKADSKTKQLSEVFVGANWSPDSKYVAYVAHPFLKSKTRELRLHHIATHKQQVLSKKGVQVQTPITWSSNSQSVLYSGLVNYQQYYDETIHKKVYLGGMQIFSSDIKGKSEQLTSGDHLYKYPIFSPGGSQIAYLYADKLNARTLQLKQMNVDGSNSKILTKSVAQNAKLQWQ